ncbi:uncharacterized protein LOC127250579 isoform X2 [Andrographis paniculata]|uniref:uncharacterized protein LOC127250579 isoform X2 n=1 Tax=Andrographis paniculata TaxID=175694 RepID=UPI0021E73C83|nr:uncharacterized protein LOC127250579 isoform X2 [Andrographis paniculata]
MGSRSSIQQWPESFHYNAHVWAEVKAAIAAICFKESQLTMRATTMIKIASTSYVLYTCQGKIVQSSKNQINATYWVYFRDRPSSLGDLDIGDEQIASNRLPSHSVTTKESGDRVADCLFA